MRYVGLLLCLGNVWACGVEADIGDSIEQAEVLAQNADPRCRQLCVAEEAADASFGSYCSKASVSLCFELCAQVVAAPATLSCANCYLQDASFASRALRNESVGGPDCSNEVCPCFLNGCEYDCDDDADQLRCQEEVFPREAVECQTEFTNTNSCSAVCEL